MKILIDQYPQSEKEQIRCAATNCCLIRQYPGETCESFCKKFITLGETMAGIEKGEKNNG